MSGLIFSQLMSRLANDLLTTMFQASNLHLFLNEYTKISAEFDTKLEANIQLNKQNHSSQSVKIPTSSDLNEDSYSVDYFYEYVKPFFTKKSKSINNSASFRSQKLDLEQLWVFDDSKNDFNTWLHTLVTSILVNDNFEDEICTLCRPLFERDVQICEVVLPYLLDNLFVRNKDLQKSIACQLNKIFKLALKKNQANLVRLLIKLIEFFRKKEANGKQRSCNFWVSNQFLAAFDYLLVAEAAQVCGLFSQSVFYIEVWFSQEVGKLRTYKSNINMQLLNGKSNVLELLMNAYRAMGEQAALDSDLIYLIDSEKRIKFCEEKNFEDTLYSYDSYLNNLMIATDNIVSTNHAQIGLLKSLKNNGLDGLLKKLVNIDNKERCLPFVNDEAMNNELTDVRYNTSWKLGIWTELQQHSAVLDDRSFDKNFHSG